MQKRKTRPSGRKSPRASSKGGQTDRRARIIRIVLADDHPMVRDALRALLTGLAGVKVVGEAATGLAAVATTIEHQADMVIMDVSMPDLGGVEATRRILAQSPDTRVIALSAYSDGPYVQSMLQAGAVGYVLKTEDGMDLLAAIETVAAGSRYLPREYQAGQREQAEPALRPREREVLRMLTDGQSNKQIGVRMGISVRTVETHRKNITRKLGIYSLAELTKYAIRNGLTEL